MNSPDDSLYSFLEESKVFFSDDDDHDLDYAIALSLQKNNDVEIKRESDASFSGRNAGDRVTSLSHQEKCAAELEKRSEVFLDTIDQDYDYAFALSLQVLSEDVKEKPFPISSSKSDHKPIGIVDEQWEVLDPNPDIHALFLQYNVQFFYGKLDGVEVKWSPRMTLCAGVCSYEGRGGLCSVRLSLPLLKLRPRRDLVETLLHEMIHAYLFVTANNKDHNAHGPEFLKHMHRINKETGTKISVYHSFHDEVDSYRKHIWRCNGPCQKKSPYYGYVKRAINRAPGPKDVWWAQHQSSCGGTFTKLSEPEDYKKKSTKTSQNDPVKRKPLKDADNQLSNIKKFLKNSSTSVSKNVSNVTKSQIKSSQGKEEINLTGHDKIKNISHNNSVPVSSNEANSVPTFSGNGFLLGSSSGTVPRSFLANIRREIASSSSTSLKTFSVRSEIGSSGLKNSTQLSSNNIKNTVNESCVLGALDSTQTNVGYKVNPVNKYGSQKTISDTSKKPSFVQSSIDKFVSSPARPLVRNNINNAIDDHNLNITPKVKCPVCFKPFTSLEINAHLDSCLTL